MRRTLARWSRTATRRFVRQHDGASLAEYAMLLGVLAVALILVITQFKDSIGNSFSRATNTLAATEAGTGQVAGGGSVGGGTTGGGTTGGGATGGGANGGGPPCGTPPCGGPNAGGGSSGGGPPGGGGNPGGGQGGGRPPI